MRLAVLTLLTLAPAAASAADYYVDDDAPCRPPGNGTSRCPFAQIQDAMNVATAGDLVFVQPGTYGHFDLKDGVFVGGLQGAAVTVVDLAAGPPIGGAGSGASLYGLTIRNGSGAGAVALDQAQPFTVSYCLFEDNHSLQGGTLNLTDSYGLVNHTTFQGNFGRFGGGIHASKTPLEVTDSHFVDNEAAIHGGAINVYEAPLWVWETTFTNNTASYGGAINTTFGDAQLSGITVVDNRATHHGGGVAAWFGSTRVISGTFDDNHAGAAGGGLWATSFTQFASLVELEHTHFHGNRGGSRGGAVYARQVPVQAVRSIFDGNRATQGSGLYLDDATTSSEVSHLVDSLVVRGHGVGCALFSTGGSTAITLGATFTDNVALGGWGRSVCAYSGSTVSLFNSVAWHQASEFSKDASSTIGAYYSDVYQPSGVYPGSGNINAPPQFAAGSYVPAPGSPLVDAASAFFVVSSEDVYGQPRSVDGDGDGTITVDMGAAEAQ